MSNFRVGCVQVNAKNDLLQNIFEAERLGLECIKEGADIILYPENVLFMAKDSQDLKKNSYKENVHKGLDFFKKFAKDNSKWILVGSIAITLDSGKLANRSFMINSEGIIVARYDKVHLFDVRLENGEEYYESNNYQAGDCAVITKTEWASFGLTICYDLRFPEFYRQVAISGVSAFAIPSAFTKTTGQKHWHTLIKARAIETGSFILAPAQTGSHPGGRKTFGHSLIIDPMGAVIEDAGEEVGIILADIDINLVKIARNSIPATTQNRSYTLENM